MKKQTVEEFIAEMRKKPQTFGWDAVLVFARNKTNVILEQDYIDRFHAQTSYLPLINSEFQTDPGRKSHYIESMQVDKPMLSFINASIEDSMARLQLRSVAGKLIEIEIPSGTQRNEVMRIAMADGLVGPTLEMDIKLNKVSGTANEVGKVVLDMSEEHVVEYRFNGVESVFEATLLAKHLGQEVDAWEASEKKFELSKLRLNEGDVLQPEQFIIRTQAGDDAAVMGSEGYEDGAVLIFVNMKGNGEGSYPNKEMMYLLPKGGEYSTNLVLSNDLILRRLFVNELVKREQLKGVEFKPDNKPGEFALMYYASNGSVGFEYQSADFDNNSYTGFKANNFECSFSRTEEGKEQRLRAAIDQEAFVVAWDGSSTGNTGVGRYSSPTGGGGWATVEYHGLYRAEWTFKQPFPWSLKSKDGRKYIEMSSGEGAYTFNTIHERDKPGESHNQVAEEEYTSGLVDVRSVMRQKFDWLQAGIADLGVSIDAFRLNGLLFRDESVVEPEVLRIPGDMCVLGKLSGARTDHTLVNPRPVVEAGKPFTFAIEPPVEGVNWEAVNLPGEVGNPGSFKDGVYQPPSAESFGHTFKRALVVATKGGWTGKALVHVVPRPISVYPLVAAVSPKSNYTLWAASVDGKDLTAEVAGNAEGKVTAASDPQVQQIWSYRADIEVPEDGWPVPLPRMEDNVVRVDKVIIKSASHNTSNEMHMIVPLAPVGQYNVRVKAVEGQAAALELELWSKKLTGAAYKIKADELEWCLLVGKGTLHEKTGAYTPNANVHEHFIVVAGLHIEEEEGEDEDGEPVIIRELTGWGYKIIPVPFVSIEKFNNLLASADRSARNA